MESEFKRLYSTAVREGKRRDSSDYGSDLDLERSAFSPTPAVHQRYRKSLQTASPPSGKLWKKCARSAELTKKRKDTTPKKLEEGARKKLQAKSPHVVCIDITGSDDQDVPMVNDAKRSLFRKNSEYADSDNSGELEGEFSSEEEEVKVEDGSDSITSDPELSLPALTFYRNDKRLPIYSKQNPDIQRLFRICLKKDVPVDRLVTRKPVRIKDTATFIVN